MKLHLPIFLNHAIIACIAAFLTKPFAQAETIIFSSNPTNWSTGAAAEYTKNEGDVYSANGIQWNVLSGSYDISSTSQGGSDVYGISVSGGATLTNDGTLNVKAEGAGFSGGISCRSGSIVNNGSMNITTVSTEMYSSYGFEADGTLNNFGNIDISASSGGWNTTGLGADGEVVNSGTIISNATGSMESADLVGVYIGGGGSNESGGVMEANVRSDAGGMWVVGFNLSKAFSNNGKMVAHLTSNASSGDLYGFYIKSTFTNGKDGIISANVDFQGGAFATAGVRIRESSLFNSGKIETDSVELDGNNTILYLLNESTSGAYTSGGTQVINGLGAVYLGGSVAADNTVLALTQGSSVNVSSDLSLSEVTLNLVDDVTLSMGGDLTVGSDVTTNWNDHSLTIDNGGTRHSVSWKNEFAGSWSGSFTLNENDGSLTMVQKQVDKYVGLSTGNITIGGGVLKATETLELGGSDTTMTISSDTTSLVLHGEHGGNILNAIVGAEGIMVSAGDGNTLTLDSSVLTLGGGLNLLKNVMVIGSTQIKSELGSALSCDLVTFVLDSLNSSLGAQSVLAAEDDAALFMTPYTSGGTAFVGTNIFDNVTVSGDMTLDLSFWAEEIDRQGYDSLAFSLGDSIAEGTQIRASFDGVNYATAAYGADGMAMFSVADIKSASNIPEPTTATLSLLVFTAFVARRRRKAA